MTRSIKTPTNGRRLALASVLLLLSAALSCKGGGKLVLHLERPSANQGLDPMEDPRLDHFSLVLRDNDGEPLSISAAPVDIADNEAPIGEVPVGSVGSITLVGYSATNQVLAWAESGPLTINASEEVQADLPIRKPFTYVAGGPSILGFDTTLTGAEDDTLDLAPTQGITTDVASTPDGRFLLISVGDPENPIPLVSPSLQLVSTATHTPGRSIPLAFIPGALSLSPDGRWAVVAEYQPPGVLDQASQVAVINVEAALAGSTNAAKTLNMANAGRVAFVRSQSGEDLAVILRAPLGPIDTCASAARNATLSTITLEDGTLAGPPVDLGESARDLASDPKDHRVYVALPCSNRIVTFDVDDHAVVGAPWNLTAPSSVQISGSSLWVGSNQSVQPGTGVPAPLTIHRIDPFTDPQTEPTRMDIPFPSEAVVAGTAVGSLLLVEALPYYVSVYRLSVPPGETNLSALVVAGYHADPITVTDGPNTWQTKAVDLISASYLGIDTGAQDIRRRFRARCYAIPEDADPNDPATWLPCRGLPPNEQPQQASFFPRGVTSIYGVP